MTLEMINQIRDSALAAGGNGHLFTSAGDAGPMRGNYTINGPTVDPNAHIPGFYSLPTNREGHWRSGGAWQGHREYVDGPRVGTVAVANKAMEAELTKLGISQFEYYAK